MVVGNGGPINSPFPNTVKSIGPLGNNPTQSPLSQSDIVLAKFTSGAVTAGHHIVASLLSTLEPDVGFIRFAPLSLTATAMDQQFELRSADGPVPFKIYPPIPNSCCAEKMFYTISPLEGVTPATITVHSASAQDTAPYAILIAAPHATPSLQLLPVVTYPLSPSVSATLAGPLETGPSHDPVETTMTVRAVANDSWTLTSLDESIPFQITQADLPSWLSIDPLQGTTPATLRVRATPDSSMQAGFYSANVTITPASGGLPVKEYIAFTIDAAPSAPYFGLPQQITATVHPYDPPSTWQLKYSPPQGTAFQVITSSDRLSVSPRSGVGPTTFQVTIDPATLPLGTDTETFTVNSAAGNCTVSYNLTTVSNQIGINTLFSYGRGPANASPGVRVVVDVGGLPLPQDSWSDKNPAPRSWNGLSFRYGSQTLPILGVNAALAQGQFAVQLPNDLAPGTTPLQLDLVSDAKGVLASANIYGQIQAASLGLADQDAPLVTKVDGTVVSAANPVQPGDHILMSVVGAGLTQPAVATGTLPGNGVVSSPVIPITAYVGGKQARVVRSALSSTRIGVVELEIEVPWLRSGEQLLALSQVESRVYAVPVFIQSR